MKPLYGNQKKNNFFLILFEDKGFTLIELLIGLSVGGILILSFYMMFNYCINFSQMAEEREDFLLNGKYALEYMKTEIKYSEEILSTDKVMGFNRKFKENFGFILRVRREDGYKYISYYFQNGNIIRIVSSKKRIGYPYLDSFGGYNKIVENVNSIEGSKVEFQNNKIILNLSMDGKWNRNVHFKTEIFIRCPTDY